MADSTFIWNGGTGLASDPTQWTPSGATNTPAEPQSDDNVIISSGDAQFVDTPLPGSPDNGGVRGVVLMQGGTIDMINDTTAATPGLWGPNTVGAYSFSGTLLQVTNTVAAVATLTASGGISNPGMINSDANGNLTVSVLTGDLSNTGIIEATNGGTVTIQTAGGATLTNLGTFVVTGAIGSGGDILANGGSVLVTAAFGSNAGWMGVMNNGQLELNTPVPVSGIIDFVDTGTVKLDQLGAFSGSIIDMGPGDTIDLGGVNVGTISYDGTTMVLEDGTGSTLAALNMPGIYGASTGTFTVTNDGTTSNGGLFFGKGTNGDHLMAASVIACFAAGTRLASEDGPVAVEALKVGDRLCTALDGTAKPIVWIGQRRIDCASHPQPRQVWPIRVAADAFGPGQPARELMLSPDHAVYAEGVLIPVKHLVNGDTITQVPCDSVTYYHIELPRHDIVLAEGLPAESYLAGADRSVFANHNGVVAMHPDLSSRVWEAEGCAELVVTGATLQQVRDRLAAGQAGSAHRQAA